MELEMLNARCNELIKERESREKYISESILYLKLLDRNGGLRHLKPKWHLTKNGIDLNSQRYNSVPNDYLEYMGRGFTVLKDVKCENILNSISKANAGDFRKGKVFNDYYNDRYICEILFHWLNGKKMIPPTLIFNSIENFIVDGKHRFNVAYSLGAKTLPILVPNETLEDVKRHLK